MSLILELAEATGLSSGDIERVIRTAPARYKTYPIEKRSGGVRIIAQPSRELKVIQNYILKEKLKDFPVHNCAMAYEKGRNIFDNATSHVGSRVLMKLDFKDFFPSIKVKDWERFIAASSVDTISPTEVYLYSKVLFWGEKRRSSVPKCLSIGAPTSPKVSNILLYDFDTAMSGKARSLNLSYTRYADDITISGETVEQILLLEREAKQILRKMAHPKLTFNEEKRGIYAKGRRQMVTGLIVTPQAVISIGRERKRQISSLLHRSSLGQLDNDRRSLLKGLLGFCVANEPEFIGRLRRKYGNGAVNAAMKFHAPKRARIQAPPPPTVF